MPSHSFECKSGGLPARDAESPPLAERDLLALLNAGGYGSATVLNHALRGEFPELLLNHEDPT